jgi:hypothetical protein
MAFALYIKYLDLDTKKESASSKMTRKLALLRFLSAQTTDYSANVNLYLSLRGSGC